MNAMRMNEIHVCRRNLLNDMIGLRTAEWMELANNDPELAKIYVELFASLLKLQAHEIGKEIK